MMPSIPAFLPADLVLSRFVAKTGTPMADLIGRDQTRDISRRRQEAMWCLRQLTSASLVQIGGMLGGRDAGTVDNGVGRVAKYAEAEPHYARMLADLRDAISNAPPDAKAEHLGLLRAMAAGILADHRLSNADACEAVLKLLRGDTDLIPKGH